MRFIPGIVVVMATYAQIVHIHAIKSQLATDHLPATDIFTGTDLQPAQTYYVLCVQRMMVINLLTVSIVIQKV
jgi:hypothetical protein